MNINELLESIDKISKLSGLSKPFMVGGVPRDRFLGKLGKPSEIKDVDITTGNNDSRKLAEILHKKFPKSTYREYDDGHISLDIFGLHIDFSSNFVAPGVSEELAKAGVTGISPMLLEVYSRDFTINTLLEDLAFSGIYDLTKEGIKDLKTGVVRCPIDPEITIGVDPRRILRAIKFSIKYGFTIEENLKNAIMNNRKKLQSLPRKFVQDKISEIVTLDSDLGIDELIKYKILPLVPLSKTVSDILIQKRKMVHAL